MKARESGMPAQQTWQEFFTPEATLHVLGLDDPNAVVLDLGCGYGTFTVPAARLTRGTVHALDIDDEMVETTREAANAAGVTNVSVERRDFMRDGSGLPAGSVDFAMLFNILHAEEPLVLLSEARRVLTAKGRLAVIHWNHDPSTPRGPSMEIRPRPEQVVEWARQVGFEPLPPGRIDLPPYHYGYTFGRHNASG